MDVAALTLFEPATVLPVRSALLLAAVAGLILVLALGILIDDVIEWRKHRR